jgi:CheY-like chemotaxis protein
MMPERLSPRQNPERKTPKPLSTESESKAVLMMVDDDPEDVLLVRTAVKRAALPIQVDRYSNAEGLLEALAGLTAKRDPLAPNRIILLDLNMPGKGGRACLQDLKSNPGWSDIPVIIFSTSNSPEDVHQCYEHNANAYICKPDDLLRLEHIITVLYRYWFQRPVDSDQERLI